MQTGQVSVWVPIAVGVIGLLGVIAGQFVSAWREDRRWLREQHREDVRWQRELERENLGRTFADRSHWRDKKFDIYNYLLSFMKEWRDLSYKISLTILGEGAVSPREEDLDRLRKLHGDSFEYCDKIALIATDRDAQDALIASISLYRDCVETIGTSGPHVNRTQLRKFVESGDAAIDVILAAMRIDLGISDKLDKEHLTLLGP